MTPAQIDARDFSYVSAFYANPYGVRHFLVGSPFRAEARRRAWAYATTQWGQPKSISIYPRTYVREARLLNDLGLTDQ
jgi:hypothetical protein